MFYVQFMFFLYIQKARVEGIAFSSKNILCWGAGVFQNLVMTNTLSQDFKLEKLKLSHKYV